MIKQIKTSVSQSLDCYILSYSIFSSLLEGLEDVCGEKAMVKLVLV